MKKEINFHLKTHWNTKLNQNLFSFDCLESADAHGTNCDTANFAKNNNNANTLTSITRVNEVFGIFATFCSNKFDVCDF